MKARNPVSPADALLFDSYMTKWQSILNLNDWRIERGAAAASRGAMASVEFNAPARLATYRLGDFGAEAVTPKSLQTTCVHELLHVVLYDLMDAVFNRHAPEVIEAAEHKVINLFEKILLQKGAHD